MLKKSLLYSILTFLFAGSFWACNPTKNIPEGSYLLRKNSITSRNPDINIDDIEPFIRQKPNKKTLGFRMHLLLYDKGNTGKNNSINKWFKSIGEEPVLLEKSLANKSSKQIKKHLENSGYFSSSVSPKFNYKNQFVDIDYVLETPKPYKIRKYINQAANPTIKLFVDQDSIDTYIKPGDIFDTNVLNRERDRLNLIMKNHGYYFFSKEYIQMHVDSSLKSNEVDVYLKILNPKNHSHVIQDINKVTIITDYEPSITGYDSLFYEGYTILYKDRLKIKPQTLINTIFIKSGDYYQTKHLNKTYNKLASLNTFKFTNVILESHKGSSKLLDCTIQLSSFQKNTISISTEGNNTGESFGLGGNIAYRNINTLNGAEILNIKFSAITEWQRNFSTESDNFIRNYELAPEMNITFPKILFFGNHKLSKYAHSKTKIAANFSFKQRPDYHRDLSNLNFTYIYPESRFKTHFLTPIDLNLIDIQKTSSFQARLDSLNNQFLSESYSDQFITALKYSFTFNNQEVEKPLKNFSYLKISFDLGHDIFKNDFAEYVKLESDFRHYLNINERSSIVSRIYGGYAKAYGQSISVPFIKSFFSGGTNGIRAWQARSLGPGSLPTSLIATNFEQTGDVKLEFNLEYRFDIIGVFKGAFFTDIGNIWTLEKDVTRPGASFNSIFFKELAIGAGFGTRLDFNFFIFRIDVGVPIKNPALPNGKRTSLNNINLKSTVLNLGIGYPF